MSSIRWIPVLSMIAVVVGLSMDGCAPVVPELSVAVTADPTTGTVPLNVVATAAANGGVAPYIYVWTSAPGGLIAKPLQSSTNVAFAVTGTYTVTCTVTDSSGQTASGQATVTVTPVDDGQGGDGGATAGDEGGPRLFFTDLESGPNTGGEDDLGVFITLYGAGFGEDQSDSTVTIDGQEVARYVLWGEENAVARGLDMIVVQPGPDVASGQIVVNVGGRASNSLPFTVRSGNIYFVSTSGSDDNTGSFEQPWATIVHAKNNLAPGDIAYVMNGVAQFDEDNYSAALSIETGGSPGMPMAIVGYPGATATIGSAALEFGIRVPNNAGTIADDWVLAGLVLRGQNQAVDIGGDGSSRWRVVGNDISCPSGDGMVGCFAAAQVSSIAFLGNEVHDTGSQDPLPSKGYHAVYFTTDTVHVEVGWNHIHDNRTCRAIQFHSSPLCVPDCGSADTTGFNQYDLIVHDNLIHGDACDGINFATVDPSQGPVQAFNNVIYDVGSGPPPPDGDANYTGIYVAGGTNTGSDGTGTVEVFNNTLYDCGARKGLPGAIGDEGVIGRGPGSPGLIMNLTNNIIYAVNNEDYISPSSDLSLITGTNNLWFGGGNGPATLTGNVDEDPLFVDLPGFDFRLQATSPARDAGAEVSVASDFDGLSRPQGPSQDIGAFEFMASP